jgi:hypothetical protein
MANAVTVTVTVGGGFEGVSGTQRDGVRAQLAVDVMIVVAVLYFMGTSK